MKRLTGLTLSAALLAIAHPGNAEPWEFGQAVDVTSAHGNGIFHHLESSGRRNIAATQSTVALAWEDDHDGAPRIYMARKGLDGERFEPAIRISGDGEAYEPSIAALSQERFLIAWEENEHIHARVISPDGLGATARLSQSEAAQASVWAAGNRAYVAISQRESGFFRIRLLALRVDTENTLISEADCAVDPAPLQDHQFYPVSAVAGDELIVAWEDRRLGHTIIMASAAALTDICGFQPPVRISERRREENSTYGKGHGVARVALVGFGELNLAALWADKRNYWEGYDIYAANYVGKGRFDANTKVQDEFGDFARQWHAAAAGNSEGTLVAIWDDEREGNADVMLSWIEDGKWSEDLPVPGASGAGHQNHPTIALDAKGNLHIAWIERAEPSAPTRLRYLLGRLTPE